MKVALVHELLTMKGGAEKVLRVLADMFPDAPIYTLLYDEKKLGDWFPKDRIRTSTLQQSLTTPYSLLTTHSINHHLYLNRFPRAVEQWNFNDFDLVISSSSAFAHGIITNSKPKHISYIHSPARYLWDQAHAVQKRANPLARWYLSRTAHQLRIWDSEAADRADVLIAASKEVQRRIKLYWDRESEVVYPPVDDMWFNTTHNSLLTTNPYFLIVSTLAPYKHIDLAIRACNQTGHHLKIAGSGPDRSRLERMSTPNIEFYGFREGDELRDLYTDAQAVIFPGLEDFGLVPVEAMACGTPVIAYKGGGALETVIEGETGTFFHAQTPEDLAKTLESFDHNKYSREKCRLQAQKFRRSAFEQHLHTQISQLMAD